MDYKHVFTPKLAKKSWSAWLGADHNLQHSPAVQWKPRDAPSCGGENAARRVCVHSKCSWAGVSKPAWLGKGIVIPAIESIYKTAGRDKSCP